MDARIKILWRKTRWVWLGIVAAALLCLGVFLILNFSLKDAHGPFEGTHLPYSLEVPLTRSEFDQLNIEASDVRLEVAMANNINKLQIGLYGPAYDNQSVNVSVRDGTCEILYDAQPGDAADALTLRVLVPQNQLQAMQIRGDALDLDLSHMRSNQLVVENQTGSLAFNKVNANALKVETAHAPVRVENSFITQIALTNESGNTTLRQNDCRLVQADSQTGDVFIYNDTWRGQWQIASESGSITGVTKRLPYNVMIDAASEQGQVGVGYHTRYWKKPDLVQQNEQSYVGSTGNNPANALTLRTLNGTIMVEKRGRYTDIDPFSTIEAE